MTDRAPRVGGRIRAAASWLLRGAGAGRFLDDYRLREEAARWTAEDDRMASFYRQFVREGDLCFDVGANLGSRTRVLRALGASVVAVEPNPVCARALRHAHRTDSFVSIEECAVADRPGVAQLLVSNTHVLSTLSREWIEATQRSGRLARSRWDRHVTVRVTSLDDLIDRHGLPSFVKIDVEGHEAPVIRGLSRAPRCVSFEFTPEFLDGALECVERLAHLGLTRANYSLGESMVMCLPQWVSPADLVEVISQYRDDSTVVGDVYLSRPDLNPSSDGQAG